MCKGRIEILGSFFVALVLAIADGVAREESPSATESKVELNVALADPVILHNQKQTTYLKIGLTGFELHDAKDRAPVNIALVVDKSSSMSGDKIEKAKVAAMAAIDRLRSSDIVSVIAYNHGVEIVLPATRLADKALAKARVRKIQAGGSTALFAGVCKGAAEVRKFLDEERVNRVILLSDGQANVGPNSPSELGQLGASLMKEQIAVTTLGLGLDYNEDLMWKLAAQSNGNHHFIEDAAELMAVFEKEFRDVLSVVAQEVMITIDVGAGVRPVRVLGQEADIHGQQVHVQLNQLYADQERFILLELEVPATPCEGEPAKRPIADVSVRYANLIERESEVLSATVEAEISSDRARCRAHKNRDVLEKWVLLEANRQSELATLLRDEGLIEAARQKLISNDAFLRSNATLLDSDLIRFQQATNFFQSQVISNPNWNRNRKLMRRDQNALQSQAPGYGKDGGGYGSGYGRSMHRNRQKAR